MTPQDKPILTTEGQIVHLQANGVKFELMSAKDAHAYLEEHNNYFKLRAYRKNFPKHPGGNYAGQYINLDFAMLKDLAIIDMRLRYVLIHMALDIEHFAKVKLLKAITQSGEDGYSIVGDYMVQLIADDQINKTHRADSLKQEFLRNLDNPYCGGIIGRYDGNYPVWAFVEIIPLGSFIHFYGFCADRLKRRDLKNDYYLLTAVRKLRNAAAHNNCILHDMGAKDSKYQTNFGVSQALSSISKSTRNNKLKNIRMQQIVTLLYTHSIIVTSNGVHMAERDALANFVSRMYRHIEYYVGNDVILTNFDFLKKVVDILFP